MTALHWRTALRAGYMAHAFPAGTLHALCGADPVGGWSRSFWTDLAAAEYLKTRCTACLRLARERVMQ